MYVCLGLRTGGPSLLALELAICDCMAQQKGKGMPKRSGSQQPCLDTIWPRDAQGTRQAGAQQGSCSASGPQALCHGQGAGSQGPGQGAFLRALPTQTVWIPALWGLNSWVLVAFLSVRSCTLNIEIKMVAFLQGKTEARKGA